ncbi:MAG: 4-hydroxy-tetrahydrodipicolinate synthase [Legionellales bacterium]|nr:4-hydroxy-tetrahydrodipicolinate synthase [Legionellales bacterium]
MFSGSMVALVTPFDDEGNIDYAALEQLIDWHVEAGTDGLIVSGTTGESGTLSAQEHSSVIEFAVNRANSRLPVIAGTYGTATQDAVEKTRHAMQLGVDACLIMTPAYIKPTQEGLYQHYLTIAKSAAIPQILYNVPSRTAVDLLPETVERLATISNIVGIKEATGNTVRAQEILSRCGDSMTVYSGDDATALALMMLGAKGVISVTANVAPKLMKHMTSAVLSGDYSTALKLNDRLAVLHKHLFIEANPIPSKWCLSEMGLIKNSIRLPLTPLSSCYHGSLREAMQLAEVN